MSRYIDADTLLKQVIKKKPEVARVRYTEGFNDAILRVRSMIAKAPAVDVKADTVKKMAKILLDDIHLALDSNYKVIREHGDKDSEPIRELVTRVKGKIDALRGIEGLVLSTVDEMLEGKK